MHTVSSSLLAGALRLYVIIDPAHCAGRPPLDIARRALAGGATCLQLRAKDLTDRERLELGRSLTALASEHAALFLMNDRVDLAVAVGADGVHVGPRDLPVEVARRLMSLDDVERIVGASAASPELALEYEHAGADYLGCGALYDASGAKPEASSPRGPEWISDITARVSVPVVGIGGITPGRAGTVIANGAAGVAVIRAVGEADDPERAARAMRDEVDAALRRRE